MLALSLISRDFWYVAGRNFICPIMQHYWTLQGRAGGGGLYQSYTLKAPSYLLLLAFTQVGQHLLLCRSGGIFLLPYMPNCTVAFAGTLRTVAPGYWKGPYLMPRRKILTGRQRAALLDLPIDEASLLPHYTLADDDLEIIRARRHPHNRFGFAFQLCALRYPGRLLTSEYA